MGGQAQAFYATGNALSQSIGFSTAGGGNCLFGSIDADPGVGPSSQEISQTMVLFKSTIEVGSNQSLALTGDR